MTAEVRPNGRTITIQMQKATSRRGPKVGRPRTGVPYTKDSLVDDFATCASWFSGKGRNAG